MGCITLTTDFGWKDGYVAMMKGAMLSIAPGSGFVDICHDIPPQDIAAGADMLVRACGYFPGGTVHLAVVDPGVGSGRAIIAAQADSCFFVAPDNGLLYPLLQRSKPEMVVHVENPLYFRTSVSSTFHGRDIMAPVCAHLSSGVPLADLGPRISVSDLVPLLFPEPSVAENRVRGVVRRIDHFGNLITSIPVSMLPLDIRSDAFSARIGLTEIWGLQTTYASRRGPEPIMLAGSDGNIEIAVPGGSAAQVLNAHLQDPVDLSWPGMPRSEK